MPLPSARTRLEPTYEGLKLVWIVEQASARRGRLEPTYEGLKQIVLVPPGLYHHAFGAYL